MNMRWQLAQAYRSPIQLALGLELIFVLLLGTVLDGSVLLRAFAYSSIPFWAGTLFIVLRRPRNPTNGDLIYIRWGLIVLGLLVMSAFLQG